MDYHRFLMRMLAAVLVCFAGCSGSTSQTDGDRDSKASEDGSSVPQNGTLVERYLDAAGLREGQNWPPDVTQTVRLFRSPAERAILKEIRNAEQAERLEILAEMARAEDRYPSANTRLDDITHAVVGLDRDMRSRVIETIVRPGCGEESDGNELVAVVQIGVFLQVADEIPGFVETAVRVMLGSVQPGDHEERMRNYRRLWVLAERFSDSSLTQRCRLWAALVCDEQIYSAIGQHVDAKLMAGLSQADPNAVGANYEGLWNWFLDRRRITYAPGVGGEEAAGVAEQEPRCVEYFKVAIERHPEVAVRSIKDDTSGRRMQRLARAYPELLALFPAEVTRQAAEREAEIFLAALEGRQLPDTQPERRPGPRNFDRGESRSSPKLPYLHLANNYLPEQQRQALAKAIIARMRTASDEDMNRLLRSLSATTVSLTGEQCVAVLELLEPSPFAEGEVKLAISPTSHREFVASIPSEAADEVTRWFLDQIRGDRTQLHHLNGLAEVAADCEPQTAGTVMSYFAEKPPSYAARDAVAAVGRAVAEADANALAQELVTAAENEPDGATAATRLSLAGVLQRADPKPRYRAFEMMLKKIKYDPEARIRSTYRTDPREHLLSGTCAPALVAIVSNLPLGERQKAAENLMDTLTGKIPTWEALALVDGLVALSPGLSAEDADRAVEALVRLRAGTHRLTTFLAGRVPEERSRLIKLLVPSVIGNQFHSNWKSTGNSDAVRLMGYAAKEVSSAEARELLDTLLNLLQQQEHGASTLLFLPFIDRISADDREALARDLLRRMRESEVPSHVEIMATCVIRLGGDASGQTRAAVADRLLDLMEAYVHSMEAVEWRRHEIDSEIEQTVRGFAGPLGKILADLDHDLAGPRRDRVVNILHRIIYGRRLLPRPVTVIEIRGNRADAGLAVAELLGATQAVMPSDVVKRSLYCLASLAMDAHPVAWERVAESFAKCQGTAPPGTAGPLAEACFKNAVNQYGPVNDIRERELAIQVAAGKLDDQDVMTMYGAAWSIYGRIADSRTGGYPILDFGESLSALAPRVPAESAWPAIQDVLRRWPTATNEIHRRFLQRLYAQLLDRVPAKDRANVVKLAEQQGLTPNIIPERSRRGPSTGASTPRRKWTIEDLADEDTRDRALPQFLNDQTHLPLDERLTLLLELDDKSLLISKHGELYEGFLQSWFSRNLQQEDSDEILAALSRPDCVGFEQRLFTAALARTHERHRMNDLWELADLFETTDQ